MRRLLSASLIALAMAGSSSTTAFAEEAASTAPFRAKLVANVAVARKAATSLSSIAKQTAPKSLSADERKAWTEQSKALATGAARLNALKLRMDAVLAKANAPASEIAQTSLELANAQQAIEAESLRFASSAAGKARHDAALKAMR